VDYLVDYLKILETIGASLPMAAAIRSQRKARSAGRTKKDGVSESLINLFDFEALARQRISHMALEYISSGAGDEITLRRNRACFDELRLHPRVLVGAGHIDTSVELLGERLEFPLLLAPCAYQKLVHPEGELEAARAAAAARTPFVVSTFATVALEDIARAANASLWFQLYVHPDHGFTKELIVRAEKAGYRVLCVTVDTPILGVRDRERRAGFHLPPGMKRENLKALGTSVSKMGHFEGGGNYTILDPAINWKTLEWIRSLTRLPIVLKGVLSPDDARMACERGADGIIVSNHGGRNLDTVPATIEALPPVVDAVEGRIPVLLDGGVRRGTDIVKALAYGARAVLIGRPYLWGLGVGGAQGVEQVIRILRMEFGAAMALCGTPSISRITRDAIWRAAIWPASPSKV
jgi:4-hydroxymandelate oxidase